MTSVGTSPVNSNALRQEFVIFVTFQFPSSSRRCQLGHEPRVVDLGSLDLASRPYVREQGHPVGYPQMIHVRTLLHSIPATIPADGPIAEKPPQAG